MKILITGASSGIGRYLAGRFTEAGHEVWGTARSPQPGEDFAGRSRDTFRYSSCDISSFPAVSRLRSEIGREWNDLNGLICCGGIQAPIGPAMEVEPEAWSANLRTNLDGTFFAIRAFHDLLSTDNKGRSKVLCFSGGGASSPRPNFTAYACAKAAVVRLVENLSVEWKDAAIDINAIAPGAIATGMTGEVLRCGEAVAGAKEVHSAVKLAEEGHGPMIRAGDLVEYLLSPASDGISGRLISAPWDPWPTLSAHCGELMESDVYTLRRITPADRKKNW